MTEETFVRELERHADHVHGAPLSFDDVRGKARTIQRRRRAATAAAVAAAVAVVAIVPAVLSATDVRRSDGPQPAGPAPSGHTAVLHDGMVTMPDGGSVRLGLDNQDVQQLAVLTDGRIVVATSKPYGVQVYSSDGTLRATYPVAENVITMSAEDDAAAWVAKDMTVRVLASGADEPAGLPGIPMPGEAVGSIDAVLDAQHLLVGDHTTTSGELTADGVRDLGLDQPFRVDDVSPDGHLWAVSFLPGSDQQFGCAALYDPNADQLVSRSCEVGSLEFAPDGQHLLSAYWDNNMAGNVSVVDLDLKPVGRIAFDGRTTSASRIGWADAAHVVAAVADWRTSEWSLQQLDLHGGGAQVLDGPAPGGNPEMTADYLLSQ